MSPPPARKRPRKKTGRTNPKAGAKQTEPSPKPEVKKTADSAVKKTPSTKATATKGKQQRPTGKATEKPKSGSPASKSSKPKAAATKAATPKKQKVEVMPRGYPAPYDNATPHVPVSPYFPQDDLISYEGSRLPWFVRLLWVVFWIIALYYIVVLAWPDALRYF
jgi:hypothetical protein